MHTYMYIYICIYIHMYVCIYIRKYLYLSLYIYNQGSRARELRKTRFTHGGALGLSHTF